MKNRLRSKKATLVIMLFLIGKGDLDIESLSFLSFHHLNTEIEQVEIGKIINFISECPAWAELDEKDIIKKEKIISSYRQISIYDSNLLRKGIQDYVKTNCVKDFPTDIVCLSKIFVLNRFVCNVPDDYVLSSRNFGGWAGVPKKEGLTKLLWPLKADISGNIDIGYTFSGYYGNSYLAVEEFDYLLKNFGRRNILQDKK